MHEATINGELSVPVQRIGPIGSHILQTLDRRAIPVFSIQKHRGVLASLSTPQLHSALHTLEAGGYLQAIERGKYVVRPRAGTGKVWQENPYVIADAIAPDPHYISFWSALAYWNLTTQLPSTVYIVIRGGRPRTLPFQHHQYRLVLRSEPYFTDFEPVECYASSGMELRIPFATPEKAILDSLEDETLAGGLPEIVGALRQGLQNGKLEIDRLVQLGAKYPTAATASRLGFLLQRLGYSEALSPLHRRRTTGQRALLRPGAAVRQGSADRDWNLVVNVSDDIFEDNG